MVDDKKFLELAGGDATEATFLKQQFLERVLPGVKSRFPGKTEQEAEEIALKDLSTRMGLRARLNRAEEFEGVIIGCTDKVDPWVKQRNEALEALRTKGLEEAMRLKLCDPQGRPLFHKVENEFSKKNYGKPISSNAWFKNLLIVGKKSGTQDHSTFHMSLNGDQALIEPTMYRGVKFMATISPTQKSGNIIKLNAVSKTKFIEADLGLDVAAEMPNIITLAKKAVFVPFEKIREMAPVVKKDFVLTEVDVTEISGFTTSNDTKVFQIEDLKADASKAPPLTCFVPTRLLKVVPRFGKNSTIHLIGQLGIRKNRVTGEDELNMSAAGLWPIKAMNIEIDEMPEGGLNGPPPEETSQSGLSQPIAAGPQQRLW